MANAKMLWQALWEGDLASIEKFSRPSLLDRLQGKPAVAIEMEARSVEKWDKAKDNGWRTPLHAAAAMGNADACKALIANGADLNSKSSSSVGGYEEQTPLYAAAIGGHAEACKVLIDAGADVHAQSKYWWGSRSPLHAAAYEGHSDVCRTFAHAGVGVEVRDFEGHTPLDLAAKSGHGDTCRALVNAGADPNSKVIVPDTFEFNTSDGSSPLHFASFAGHEDCVKALIECGASINAKDKLDRSPLHWAGNVQIANTLIAAGADINSVDNMGLTPARATMAAGKTKVADKIDWMVQAQQAEQLNEQLEANTAPALAQIVPVAEKAPAHAQLPNLYDDDTLAKAMATSQPVRSRGMRL